MVGHTHPHTLSLYLSFLRNCALFLGLFENDDWHWLDNLFCGRGGFKKSQCGLWVQVSSHLPRLAIRSWAENGRRLIMRGCWMCCIGLLCIAYCYISNSRFKVIRRAVDLQVDQVHCIISPPPWCLHLSKYAAQNPSQPKADSLRGKKDVLA